MSVNADVQWVPVGEVGEVRMGKQLSPASSRESGNHVPYLRVANVLDGWIDYSDVKSMSFDALERERYSLAPGDILLNEGQSLELVGRSAIYDGRYGEFCFQNTLIRFRPGPCVISEYAQAVFAQWMSDGTFASVAKKTTSIAHLGGERFANILFPLIPLSEQEKFVETLRGLSDLKRVAEESLEKRGAVARSVLSRTFSQGLQGDAGHAICGDVIEMSGGLPLGQSGVNPAGRYRIVGSSGFAGRGDRQLTGGPTIVIGRVGEGGVGSVRFIDEPAWVTDNALWVRKFSPGWNPEFLAVYLEWFNLRKLRSQTGQPLVTQAAIKSVPVPRFQLDEQCRVVRFYSAWQEELDASRNYIGKLRLLQKTVAGNLLSRTSRGGAQVG